MKVNDPITGEVRDEFQLTGSKAQDLGLNVEGLNMAAGAIVAGNWIDAVDWVRNIVILAQSDQAYDIQVFRSDRSLSMSAGLTPTTNAGATGSGWASIRHVGADGVLGYSAQFKIKNAAAVPNTFARIRVQLLGM